MTRPTDAEVEAKVAKLPRWAREHIAVAEMRLREARAELRELTTTAKPDSNCFYRSYSYENTGLPERVELPHGMLTVKLGKDRYNREHEINITRGLSSTGVPCIEVCALNGPLRIIPQVSNSVSITTLDPTEDD